MPTSTVTPMPTAATTNNPRATRVAAPARLEVARSERGRVTAGSALRRPVRAERSAAEQLTVQTGVLFAFFLVTAMLPATVFPWAWVPIVVANLVVIRQMQLTLRDLWRTYRASRAD